MNPRSQTDRPAEQEPPVETTEDELDAADPSLATQDWDALASGELIAESLPENGDLRYEEEAEEAAEPLGEDDDNAYQESDEALPDDEEEAAIARDPTKAGTRFPT